MDRIMLDLRAILIKRHISGHAKHTKLSWARLHQSYEV